MKKLTNKKITALVMAALFATTQVATAHDTGLGQGLGGADFSSVNTAGEHFYKSSTDGQTGTFGFSDNAVVNWNNLNLNKNETLNFNAINGAKDLTILNTVSQGMSRIYGSINANEGIGKLIISNPNGMLFDGAKFTTAGDLLLTTQNMTGVSAEDLSNARFTQMLDSEGNLIPVSIKDSTFAVNGDYTIVAPMVNAEASTITANNFKIVTANGADYASLGANAPVNNKGVTFLKAMKINGNVEIVNPEGAMSISDGGEINGDLKVETKGNTFLNFYHDSLTSDKTNSNAEGVDFNNENAKQLVIKGDVDITSHGQWSLLRDTKINGNLDMRNSGGFVDIGNANISGNANLTTTGYARTIKNKYNHYVHVVGNTNIGGNLTIDSSENVHIGGYNYATQKLADGKLTVGGDLNVTTKHGHITTTIDTSAKNISFDANSEYSGGNVYGGNILSDGEAVLTAETYSFKANGYIGSIKDSITDSGIVKTNDSQIVNIMEKYINIPSDIESHDYLNIAGGEIKNITTNETGEVYIKSLGDVLLTGAEANNINITAPDKYIHITGPDVYANNINVGKETHTVEVDFPGRSFTLNYTNIRDNQLTTVRPDEVITYELTNEPTNGYNAGTHTADNTFLVGPGIEPDEPDVPVIIPDPDPVPPTPPVDEPERHLQWVPEDAMKAPVDTPVAFAADLDDDDEGAPIRKNVDGSVTVVKKMAAY